jgi:hypothetical protein
MSDQHLLNTKQVAQFAADGFLRFDGLVSDRLNKAACAQMEEGLPRTKAGTPLPEIWADTPIGEVFSMPEIQGIYRSLVGPAPLYDHHAIHTVDVGKEQGQIWHADAIIDTRMHFDIQFFYFAHDTPREMGGTAFLPGSHYRQVSESDIARYQNFKGQTTMVCEAGTVAVAHHGIWHCAQPNLTDMKRYMFKLRLNPTVKQTRLWDTADMDDPKIMKALNENHGWYGNEVRLEYVNRIKFWRFLTGDASFDMSYWMSRIENGPENELAAD